VNRDLSIFFVCLLYPFYYLCDIVTMIIFVDMKRIAILLALLFAAQTAISAQDIYLMPEFKQGVIYFRGQTPAQGKLNICAVDNTLRYLDKSGKELVANQADNILRVVIDTVAFLHYDDIYYRMYPVSIDMGVALQREVKILRDAKQGAYGTTSQTSSIKSSSTMYVDGVAYSLQEGKECPHEVTETICLYKGDTVFQLTKKNLRKMFPKKKEEIDAWFKAGNSLPKTISDALSLLRHFRGE